MTSPSSLFRSACASLLIFSILSPSLAAAVDKKTLLKDSRFSLVDEATETKASEYVMRRFPGEQLIPVRILSGVAKPGIYYIPEGTDMITALSLAGGLTSTADSDKVHVNNYGTQSQKVLSLNNVLDDAKNRNPIIGSNDIIMVDESRPVISNNTVLVITVLGSLIGIWLGAKAIQRTK